MNDETQKRLLSILTVVIAAALSRPLTNYLLDVPEKRGIKDDVKEAALKGAVRTAAVLAASILVRQVARRRR